MSIISQNTYRIEEYMIRWPLTTQQGSLRGCRWKGGRHVWRGGANILNKQLPTTEKNGPAV